MDLKS